MCDSVKTNLQIIDIDGEKSRPNGIDQILNRIIKEKFSKPRKDALT